MPTYVLRHRGGEHRVLNAETLIGRSDECALCIDHAKVSRVHALLRLASGELEIVEALLSSRELLDRPQETARTVGALLDEALEGFAEESSRIDRASAERIARAVNRLTELSPSDSAGPWADRVAERLRQLLA